MPKNHVMKVRNHAGVPKTFADMAKYSITQRESLQGLQDQFVRLTANIARIEMRLTKATKIGDTPKVSKLAVILTDSKAKAQLLADRIARAM